MRGPGKYDGICSFVREHTGAQACLLLVIGGDQGSGMSFQTKDKAMEAQIPTLLRRVASDIENGVEDEVPPAKDDVPVLPQ